MQRHEEMEPLVAGYALATLEPDEAAAFAGHVRSCRHCAEALAEMRAVADALPLTVSQVAPPPELKARLMEAVRAEAAGRKVAARPAPASRSPRRWWLSRTMAFGAAAAVLLAVFAGTAAWAFTLQNRLETSQTRLASLYEAMTVLAEADQRFEFSGSVIEPEAQGILAYSSEHKASLLMVWGLPSQPDQNTYVAWSGAGDERKSAGAMRWANGGLWAVVHGDIEDMDSIGITLRDAAPPGTLMDVVIVSLDER